MLYWLNLVQEVDETARAVRQQDPDGFGKMQRDWVRRNSLQDYSNL